MQTKAFKKGDLVEEKDIPHEIRHFFNDPQHYHWVYPHTWGVFKIYRDIEIDFSGPEIILKMK